MVPHVDEIPTCSLGINLPGRYTLEFCGVALRTATLS
jgi:hypothetical protein